MRDDHMEQIIAVIKGTIGIGSGSRELILRKRLSELNLKTGPESYVKKRRDPTALWIAEARKWAKNKCLMGQKVNIYVVCKALPPPPGVDRRVIGGVFKHPDFRRVGTVRVEKKGGGHRTCGEYILSSQNMPKGAITDW